MATYSMTVEHFRNGLFNGKSVVCYEAESLVSALRSAATTIENYRTHRQALPSGIVEDERVTVSAVRDVTVAQFPVWKTITLGTGLKTADECRRALRRAKMRLGPAAESILDESTFIVSEMEVEVDLVVLSISDLGFTKKKARQQKVIDKALELGFQLCPAEVGWQLRLQYADQPEDEAVVVVSSSGYNFFLVNIEFVFYRRLINGELRHPTSFWDADDRLVFVRPRTP